ncbi:Crp/Fnr family transcriptional regulator [Aquimarina hainanensis]|uniref:Crp/Fnr family transcriptional regulator n=1 Tax=Aquimarina hainanensis TaxID=1578017 RepID=A0ABW5NB36_9FLAO
MLQENQDLISYISLLQKEHTEISLDLIPPKKNIIEAGRMQHNVFIQKEGITKCVQLLENGTEFIQDFFGVGGLYGEIELIHNSVSKCAVITITDTSVYRIPKSLFLELLDRNSAFNRLIIESLTKKISFKADRHSFHQSHRLFDNIVRLQSNFPLFDSKISKADIANYLGITPRSLTRVLSQLSSDK